MNIKFNDLTAQWDTIETNVLPKIHKVLKRGNYIDGEEIEQFENNFAQYTNSKYAIGVSNGTDGLKLSIESFEFKDATQVIIPANTFIADALAVHYQKPNFSIKLIDCNDYYQINVDLLKEHLIQLDRKLIPNIIIIPVHLYGHPADMRTIVELAKIYNCKIIEDASQAHGAYCYNKQVGSFGDITVYSLYPGKNLGAAGDAGIITTNNEYIAKLLKQLRNYGSYEKYYYNYYGYNNRLDTIQAVILNEKLLYLDAWNQQRQNIANIYNESLKNLNTIIIPKTALYVNKNVYHQYVIQTIYRDKLQIYLKENNIPTGIHYPISIQQTKIFNYLNKTDSLYTNILSNKILSLPIHPFLTNDVANYIIDNIMNYIKKENI